MRDQDVAAVVHCDSATILRQIAAANFRDKISEEAKKHTTADQTELGNGNDNTQSISIWEFFNECKRKSPGLYNNYMYKMKFLNSLNRMEKRSEWDYQPKANDYYKEAMIASTESDYDSVFDGLEPDVDDFLTVRSEFEDSVDDFFNSVYCPDLAVVLEEDSDTKKENECSPHTSLASDPAENCSKKRLAALPPPSKQSLLWQLSSRKQANCSSEIATMQNSNFAASDEIQETNRVAVWRESSAAEVLVMKEVAVEKHLDAQPSDQRHALPPPPPVRNFISSNKGVSVPPPPPKVSITNKKKGKNQRADKIVDSEGFLEPFLASLPKSNLNSENRSRKDFPNSVHISPRPPVNAMKSASEMKYIYVESSQTLALGPSLVTPPRVERRSAKPEGGTVATGDETIAENVRLRSTRS